MSYQRYDVILFLPLLPIGLIAFVIALLPPPPPSAKLRAPQYFVSASFTIDRFTPHSFTCPSAIAAFYFLFIYSLH
jgi:hypothetical protein